MQIDKYDKLLRRQFLNKEMPPLRLTRFEIPEATDHLKLLREMGLPRRSVEECWSRFLKTFRWN